MDWKNHVIKLIKQEILAENPQTNNYALPSHLSKKVETFMSMSEDLKLCIKIVAELKKLIELGQKKDEHEHILTALWTSMIIVYAKCFTDASNAKKSKLEINDVLKYNRKNLLDIHRKIMETRHTHIAHRGNTENEQAIVFFSIPKLPNNSVTTSWHIKSLRANNFELDYLCLCEELFTNVLNVVDNKLFSGMEKVHKHITTLDRETLNIWLIKQDEDYAGYSN